MTDITDYSRYGQELEHLLLLETYPIAVKFLENPEDVPQGAVRPKRDRGYHLAQCQAFAMSRRQGMTIAMLKEDHWCWAPLMSFGLVPPETEHPGSKYTVENPQAAKNIQEKWPHFEYGKYIGIVSAPLKSASFVPDIVLIYSNTAQMRMMLMANKYKEGVLVESLFDPIDSCIYSTVPAVLNRQYRITLPDPGDYERALARDDEIILSVPPEKLENLVSGLKRFEPSGTGHIRFNQEIYPDFPRPAFYKTLFEKWGLDV
jgi:uncharacterized protein (DUF169 family)